MFAEAANIL